MTAPSTVVRHRVAFDDRARLGSAGTGFPSPGPLQGFHTMWTRRCCISYKKKEVLHLGSYPDARSTAGPRLKISPEACPLPTGTVPGPQGSLSTC